MQLLPGLLTFVLLLTSCAAPAQPTMAPVNVNEPEFHAPVLDRTFETSLLVTEWKGGSKGNFLFPLDPATGTPLPDYTPISLGYTFFHAFSPDRETLAVVSFPNQSSTKGNLVLIDLRAWKTRYLALEINGWVNSIIFSPDGKRLAITHGDSRFTLTMVDIEQEVITAQNRVDSFVSRLQFTENGEELMLYRPTINSPHGMTAGPPQVLLLDAADLTQLWSAELEEVHDGIFPKDENVTSANIHEPGQAFYISPGLVFAPDRDALYIVHADSEKLTTVDFQSQTIETVGIQNKLTWFERLLTMTADVAHAKIGDGITRQAAISLNGQYLYIVGVNNSTFEDSQGNWQMEQTPLGLEILQTKDGSRVEQVETDTTELSLSPDGRFLYLRNWGDNQDNIPWTEIFDTASGKFVTRKSGISGVPALLMNGEFLLVSTYSTAETSHHMSVFAPDASRVLAEWTAPQYIWWLSTP